MKREKNSILFVHLTPPKVTATVIEYFVSKTPGGGGSTNILVKVSRRGFENLTLIRTKNSQNTYRKIPKISPEAYRIFFF